ncbi:MAG: alpha/beta fold hydrolase [Pseudomonadota bacterium]
MAWTGRLLAVLALGGCATLPPPPAKPWPDVPRPLSRFEPLGEPRATIVALHGYNDRKAAFLPFGAAATAAGVRVLAIDFSGFGASVDRSHWPGTDALVADVREAVAEARRLDPDGPLFVLGESMGAAVTMIVFAAPDAPEVDGLIWSAPAVWAGDSLNPLFRAGLRVIATLAPNADLASGRPATIQVSDNVPMLIALGRDPEYLRTARATSLDGLIRVMDEAVRVAPAIDLPRLILIGERDEAVPADAYARFLDELDPQGCTLVTYGDGWHLLLRDTQRAKVAADVLAWVTGRPLPSDARSCVVPTS